MSINYFCPETGLEFKTIQNKQISDSCRISFASIGKYIILIKPVGFFNKKSLIQIVDIFKSVSKSIRETTGFSIGIIDSSQIENSSIEFRTLYDKYLINKDLADSYIFFNAKASLNIMIKIAKRINLRQHIYIEENYREALKKALAILDSSDLENYRDSKDINFKGLISSRLTDPVEIISDPDFQVTSPDFQCRSVIINRHIIHTTSFGYFRFSDVEKVDIMRQAYNRYLEKDSSIDYVIVDESQFTGSDFKSKKQFITTLKRWHERTHFRMYLVYGSNTFYKAAAQIAYPFLPFRGALVKNLQEAIQLINEDMQNREPNLEMDKYGSPLDETDKIIHYLGSIAWDETGMPQPGVKFPNIKNKNTLLEAVHQIKEEIDYLIKEREESLREKQYLIKEIQHRVKNNFMMINNMLSMKKSSTNSEEAVKIIEDLQSKITAMSDLHTMLYENESIQEISLDIYLQKLILKFSKTTEKVSFSTDFRQVLIETGKVIPLGLIISELIINSLKYAFSNKESGLIQISLSCRNNDTVSMVFSDNGPGLPENSNQSSSQGMTLIKALVKQLNGRYTFTNNSGLVFSLHFPIAD